MTNLGVFDFFFSIKPMMMHSMTTAIGAKGKEAPRKLSCFVFLYRKHVEDDLEWMLCLKGCAVRPTNLLINWDCMWVSTNCMCEFCVT